MRESDHVKLQNYAIDYKRLAFEIDDLLEYIVVEYNKDSPDGKFHYMDPDGLLFYDFPDGEEVGIDIAEFSNDLAHKVVLYLTNNLLKYMLEATAKIGLDGEVLNNYHVKFASSYSYATAGDLTDLPVEGKALAENLDLKGFYTSDRNDAKPELETTLRIKEQKQCAPKTFDMLVKQEADARGMDFHKLFKDAEIDRRLKSKIVSNINDNVSKDTAIKLALALHMTPDEASIFIGRTGYAFSEFIERDQLLLDCFKQKIWNIQRVNEYLYKKGGIKIKPLSLCP